MILVTGATGNVGGAVLAGLSERGVPVRALSRGGDGPALAGVEWVAGDLGDAATLGGVADGVTGLFLLSGYAAEATLLAAPALERVVLLGSSAVSDGLLAEPESTNAVVAYNVASERAVRGSGHAWTVLRPTGFHANALRWLDQLRAGDVVSGPWADVAIASIDPADIGAVAASVLADGGHDGAALRLSGPEALTPAARVAILADVLDRPLTFAAQDDATARAEQLKTTPAAFVDAFFRFFSDGESDESTVSDSVERVLGRAPVSFRAWAEAHADAFG